MQPQRFAVPPPPHVWGAVHIPQWSMPPQPSDASPQSRPSDAHVFGVHGPAPHWLGAAAPHTCVGGHMPHMSVCPQPSDVVPQLAPCAAQVVGLQAHLFAMHERGVAQFPQSSFVPHPSSTMPHSAWSSRHVFG
jgi:hypothetical protein